LTSNYVLYLSLNGESGFRIVEKLQRAEITIHEAESLPDAQEKLGIKQFPVCVVRCDTVNDTIFELLNFIGKNSIRTKLIVTSKTGTVEETVRLIKAGAIDFIVGDSNDARIVESILKTVANCLDTFPANSGGNSTHPGDLEIALVGGSSIIREIRSAVNLVAKTNTTVLITGESGTGKEVVARLLHTQSNRASKPFIALNCATLPKDVIENELFGHEKGAFTGALIKKPGCFELADTGTLLFDELAEMSLDTQAKLLRAIETQKFRRLGGKEEIKVDVRVIAATNRNIATALKTNALREDLYYRLSVIEIYIPPVRERKEDSPLLVDYFLSVFTSKYGKTNQRFTDECLEMLYEYAWPGNVREIRNVVERAVVICPHELIGPSYIPERIQCKNPVKQHINIPLGCSAYEAERILILQTLASAGNNKAKAARILGVSRKTLHNKLMTFHQSSG
jgi:DNA-binding NtrC family response regulator